MPDRRACATSSCALFQRDTVTSTLSSCQAEGRLTRLGLRQTTTRPAPCVSSVCLCRVSHHFTDTITRTQPFLSDQGELYLHSLSGTSAGVSKTHRASASTPGKQRRDGAIIASRPNHRCSENGLYSNFSWAFEQIDTLIQK